MFLYADIQWISSDPALAGINAGDGVNHVTIPGSQTSRILNIGETSNVGVPGIWIFRVGEGNTLCLYVHVYTYVYNNYVYTYTSIKHVHIECMYM